MKPSISVHHISKQYYVGQYETFTTLRDTISNLMAGSLHRLSTLYKHEKDGEKAQPVRTSQHIWALKDVSFEVNRGEVVGIIGKNGAGKSTILKILSRITEPTEGIARIRGRVGSLLEVGTGFHPELTGRENIFLNGAILGMTRKEINRKFDEIVNFAEMETFIDTPVKHYSSGMFVRLAFSVAAHLEPEILIVDEVLAVGDLEFQKKCLGKMKNVVEGGRTVLFVSHNMVAVRNLCTRAILLSQGQLIYDGEVDSCIQKYISGGLGKAGSTWERPSGYGNPNRPLSIQSVSVDIRGEQPNHLLDVQINLASLSKHKPAFIAVDIQDVSSTVVMQALPTVERFIKDDHPFHSIRLTIHLPPMIPRKYGVTVWAGSHNTQTYDEAKDCVSFEIGQTPTQNRTFPHTPDHGYVVPQTDLEYKPLEHPDPMALDNQLDLS
jgi:lipopolysaccharide transport system ATP-binding protein